MYSRHMRCLLYSCDAHALLSSKSQPVSVFAFLSELLGIMYNDIPLCVCDVRLRSLTVPEVVAVKDIVSLSELPLRDVHNM
jgi:hypothetical protein